MGKLVARRDLRPASNKNKDISRMQAAGTDSLNVSFEGRSWVESSAEALPLLCSTPKISEEMTRLL